MAGLFSLFNVGLSAVNAQNAGVSTVARNTANASTPGYSRQSVDLRSELGGLAGGGVKVGAGTRSVDLLLAARTRLQQAATGRSRDLSRALTSLEASLVPERGGIPERIGAFAASLSQLRSAPLDPALRQEALVRANDLASAINRGALDIEAAQVESDHHLAELTATASELASEIATINRSLVTSDDPALADRRDLAAAQLAELTGGRARIDPDGRMRVVLEGGAVLVEGDRAMQLTTAADPARGGRFAVHIVDGDRRIDVTGSITEGRIGGELAFRDRSAAGALAGLDQLAFDLATSLNAAHRAHAGLDGTTGRDLFVEPAAVEGAAKGLTLDAAVAADPSLLATRDAALGQSDTSGLLALEALFRAPAAGGGTRTFSDQAIKVIGDVGAETASARTSVEIEEARADFLAALRDSVSGVSLEEELARLSAFQHAAQAAHELLATVNELMDDLMRRI